ncbi:hypothetical protein MYCTH_2117854 [Thermothelomyces thermophilus ATCC 42464]|uniref:Uncharacterized protein n=1 Tax=Thermothelomyces thermophilus (strain ATCC 42464 / BCRC 31852 / DSM 1799) TaxID=573729 RepID=G2QCK8_THET4|nr:uncharacterized protein MYCTH_2117854 [Thermothelomyces thermophilus ATCC 42464]AEO57331.1 hypothetical protein MYCTH_2117854 [Thermothelomyces thermophilus ATCC 42464]
MEYPPGDPRNGTPAKSIEANEDNPAKDASEAPAYPSPILSAIPSLHSPPASPRTTTQPDDWKITGEGIKNAKKYWKLVYANQRQRRSRAKKRKDYGGANDQGRTKRRQGAGSSAPLQFQSQSSDPPATADPDDEYEPATAGVEHDVLAPVTILARLDKAEQMQPVKANVDLNDPLVLRDLQELHEAVVSFGHGNCRFVDGKWELHGFGTSLYHHQVIGVSWMLSRELHPAAPNGGILADEMGLGKTVQILACMSQNIPGKNAKASKTLIIVPKRLIAQWFDGIVKHCSNDRMKRVLIHGAGQRILGSQWEGATIILTNYSQLHRQLPPERTLLQIEEMRQKGDPGWKTLLREEGGRLFQTDWHRVVLDEGHAINNRSSETSRACRLLSKKHGWVLTGTPITNKPEEFFTYLDFITSKFSKFGDYQDLMGDGVDIPKSRPTELITVEFSPLEASMHQPTKDRLQQLREHSETRKGADRSLAVPSGELRRLFNYLRYFPSHPALVEPTYLSRQPLQYFCRACRNALVSPLIAECGHAFCRECLRKVSKEKGFAPRCPGCGENLGSAREAGAECYRHNPDQFRELTKRYASTAMPQDDKRMKRVRKPGDDEFGLQPRLVRGKKTNKGGKRRNKSKSGTKRSSQRAKSKRNNEIEQIRTNAGAFLKECDTRPWDPIPHSAKTRATMDLIAKWQEEAPDDKIIVFVQWIPMLSFLGRMLFQNGFRFVYLWGEMEPDDQERCIRAFEQIADIKVMLISVSCGAHGLNLTVANRAIVFDHWWHEGWERQAFARIHRIGQTKEVHTAKLVVKGSMDETVMTIQASKREAIRTAVGERTNHAGDQDTYDDLFGDGSYDEGVLNLDRMESISDEKGSKSDGETETETEVESCSDDGDSDDEEDEREFDTDNTTSSGSDEEYVASSTGTHRGEDEDDLNTDGDGAASKEL